MDVFTACLAIILGVTIAIRIRWMIAVRLDAALRKDELLSARLGDSRVLVDADEKEKLRLLTDMDIKVLEASGWEQPIWLKAERHRDRTREEQDKVVRRTGPADVERVEWIDDDGNLNSRTYSTAIHQEHNS